MFASLHFAFIHLFVQLVVRFHHLRRFPLHRKSGRRPAQRVAPATVTASTALSLPAGPARQPDIWASRSLFTFTSPQHSSRPSAVKPPAPHSLRHNPHHHHQRPSLQPPPIAWVLHHGNSLLDQDGVAGGHEYSRAHRAHQHRSSQRGRQ